MMTESRQQILLQGQTGLTRKVFDMVPIQEYWSETAIMSRLRLTSTQARADAVRACLLDLKDIGLINEPIKGHFQQAAVKEKTVKLTIASEATMQHTPQPGQPIKKAKATLSPTDQLATLGTELTLMATDIGERLRAMALRIEEVALSVEGQREEDARLIAKANQLKHLLQGFSNDA